jgi:hypothetical protein
VTTVKDARNPVTRSNGGAILTHVGGPRGTLVYVHSACKDAWAQNRGGTTFEGLAWPSLERTIHCDKCGKFFEIVAQRSSEKGWRYEDVPCPYDDCGGHNGIRWPKNHVFFVRTIPLEM